MSKYIMMGATYCLIKYIESSQSFSFAPGSLKLKIYDNEAGDFLKIDRRTALNLELINNTRTGSQKNTLFGTINRTCPLRSPKPSYRDDATQIARDASHGHTTTQLQVPRPSAALAS